MRLDERPLALSIAAQLAMEAILCRSEVSAPLAIFESADGMAWDGMSSLVDPYVDNFEPRLCASGSSLTPSGGDFAFGNFPREAGE